MRDIALLWNARLGCWVVAIWDRERRWPVAPSLRGCETVTEDESHWSYVTSCLKPRGFVGTPPKLIHFPGQDQNRKAFQALEPGDWLIRLLREASSWHDESIPEAVKRDPGRLADWIQENAQKVDDMAEEADFQDFAYEAERDLLATYRGRKSIRLG